MLRQTGWSTQGEDATLSIELGEGTTAGDQYDRLVVGGLASLDGTLNVALIDVLHLLVPSDLLTRQITCSGTTILATPVAVATWLRFRNLPP